jgi:CubicO group peptidase (beta-lactamase class C family)
MTKLVTATAVMQLAERGALDLDGPAAELVRPLARATWHTQRVMVTIRQLLSQPVCLTRSRSDGYIPPTVPHPMG